MTTTPTLTPGSPGDIAPPPLAMVCFDMAGTTVDDGTAVMDSFAAAADSVGLTGDDRAHAMDYAIETMGQSKIVVFRAMLGDDERARAANAAFEAAYDRIVAQGAVRAMPGAVETFTWCRDHGLRVCLTTGFAPATRDAILATVGWEQAVDLVLSPADAGRGRPYPDMLLAAVVRLGIDDVRQVVAVGDTASDLWSGHRAGASLVVGVLSGAHGPEQLATAPHTHIIDSVADLPGILGQFVA
jgi:phosphonatase-like hydrolase